MPPRALQLERQVTDHGIGRGQGFAEIGQESLRVDGIDDGEDLC